MDALDLFAALGDEPLLFTLLLLLNGIAAGGMYLVTTTHAPILQPLPDLRFRGYNAADLTAFYDTIGADGRESYAAIAAWELFPFIPAYALLLGTALSKITRWNGRSDRIAYIACLAAVCDTVETSIQRLGCRLYPASALHIALVRTASDAVTLKWILIAASIGTIFGGAIGAARLRLLRKTSRARKQA